MPNSARIKFEKARETVQKPVTKFGGQPIWLNEPQWPISKETGNPMEFICQLELSEDLFPNSKGRMAYIFMTEEEEYVDETWEPDGGENAVIIQPGTPQVKVSEILNGPTIKKYVEVKDKNRLQPELVEFIAKITITSEPDYVTEENRSSWSDTQYEKYAESLHDNKIGGTPIFLQGDEFPKDDSYRLLLQLDSTQVPFYVNFGDSGIGYAFINSDGTVGKFLWQCA